MIYGIGNDIVKIERFKKNQDKLAQRILSAQEYEIYMQKNRSIEFLAGRFAAKEAIIKASNQTLSMQQISVLYKDDKPAVMIENEVFLLSIAHEREYATAVAIKVG